MSVFSAFVNAFSPTPTNLYASFKQNTTSYSSTAMVNDPSLFVSVPSGAYWIQSIVFMQGANTNTGMRLDLNHSTQGNSWGTVLASLSNDNDVSNANTVMTSTISTSSVTPDSVKFEGSIEVVAGGVLGIRAAQYAANSKAPVSITNGSYIMLVKIG